MANITYSVSGVITLAGMSAAIEAGITGPQINVAGFRIGTQSAAEGSVALETDTDVDGYIYSNDTSMMTYSQVDQDTIIWRIRLDPSIGNFEVGNIGIVLEGGTLFCKTVLPGQSAKYASNPPTVVGNTTFYNIVMHLANAAGLINLTIIESLSASLPEVATENDLPNASTTPFNTYLVDNHTHIGEPVIAVRNNGAWMFAPHHVWPNQGINVIACQLDMFDSTALVGYACYLNTNTNTFFPADGGSTLTQGIGVRTSPYEITMSGMVSAAACGLSTPLVPGTVYYVGTGPNVGNLTTVNNGNPAGFATNTTDIFISMAGGLNINVGYTQENIGWLIGSDGIAPGLVPGDVVYLDMSVGRVWRAADPMLIADQNTYLAHRPTGVLDSTMTHVVFFGILTIPSTTAWPIPLTSGSLYFANTGTNAGKITPVGSSTRWVVGTAMNSNTLLVDMFELAGDADYLTPPYTHVKAATPAGVATMIAAAIGGLPIANAIPGAIAPITFNGVDYGISNATSIALGDGRAATNAEVNLGVSQTSFLFPWVTPASLAQWKPAIVSDGTTITGNGLPSNPLKAVPTLPLGAASRYSNLLIVNSSGVPNSVINITADSIMGVTGFSATINTASVGAGGIDTGTISASATYDIYVGYNSATSMQTAWLTIEGNAPTVPSGYSIYMRCGWRRTDSSKNLYNIRQVNDQWQHFLQSSGNTIAFPVVASGPIGSESNWNAWLPATVSLAGVVPVKSVAVDFYLYTFSGSAAVCSLSPNSNWLPYMALAGPNSGAPGRGRVILEQVQTVFVALQAGSSYVGVEGGQINI